MLETQESFGGTWLTHRYPGIRSDSDLQYMGEVIEENDLSPHIRYRHHISSAGWSSADNLWTIEA